MSSDDKKRELATNRLLDILRSQQSNIGKPEKKLRTEQKDEVKKEPVSSEEPKDISETPSNLSILIPDPNRFATKSRPKTSSGPKEKEPIIPKSEQIEVHTLPVEPKPDKKESSIVEPQKTTTLESSPGLNALRKKLGLLKQNQAEKVEDNQPADLFSEPEKDNRKPEKEKITVNDLLSASKKTSEDLKTVPGDKPAIEKDFKKQIPIKKDRTVSIREKGEKPLSEFFKRDSDISEEPLKPGGISKSEDTEKILESVTPEGKVKSLKKEEKPLSEFFKKGSDISEKPLKPDGISKSEDTEKILEPVTPEGKVKSLIKEAKPLNEFFKRGMQPDKEEGEKPDSKSRIPSIKKPEIKSVTHLKKDIPEEKEVKAPVDTTKAENKKKKSSAESASRDKKKKRGIKTRIIKPKSEKIDKETDIEPDIKEKSSRKKEPLLLSFLNKLKFKSRKKPLEKKADKSSDKKIETTETEEKSNVPDVAPASFNESLITFLEVEDYKLTLMDHLNTFIQRFDESSTKLAVVTDEQTLLLLLVSRGLKGMTVESYKYFILPYKLSDRTIKTSHDLLNYVLSEVLTSKEKKTIYGTYFSTKIQSKTQVLQTPELSRKELADLVDWNSRKNLSFPADQGISNWEIAKSEDKSKKRDVVIGVIDSKSINPIYNTFTRNNVRLRFTCTLPILLWKTFIKNYPDRKSQCNVLIHLGEIHTIVLVINNFKLLFVREIAIGTQDFYKSIMQRVEKKDKSTIDIDFEMAKQITHQYGFPKDVRGFTVGTKVNLYKLAIFQRPVVERISGELGRSLNYFKKQNPDLVWEELVFDGIGATLPKLLETLRDNLNIDVSLLNPIRTSKVHYSDSSPIPKYLLPNFAVNFALVSEEVRNLNLMPKKIRRDHKNILFSKLAGIAVGIFIPFIAISTFLSGLKIDTYTERIKILEMERNNTLSQTKEYFDLKGDTEIIQAYQNYITYDHISSENKILLLKILSNEVPDEIKITELKFKKRYPGADSGDSVDPFVVRPEYFIELTGFVLSDVSVANIQLANFRVSLQNKAYFKSIKVLKQDISTSTNGKLLFTMELRY